MSWCVVSRCSFSVSLDCRLFVLYVCVRVCPVLYTAVPFRLEAVSSSEYKLLTTAVLDRETVASYSLTLRCVDQGSPPLTGQSINIA